MYNDSNSTESEANLDANMDQNQNSKNRRDQFVSYWHRLLSSQTTMASSASPSCSSPSSWSRFESALIARGKSFDTVRGLTGDEDIKALIRKYGITEIDDVAEVITEFKNRQGNNIETQLSKLFFCVYSCKLYSYRTSLLLFHSCYLMPSSLALS